MGNNIPCCDHGQHDSKLLEKALMKESQLHHDIRLARHNRIVNSSNLSSMLQGSPCSASGINIVEGNLHPRRGSKNKNQLQRRASLQGKKGPIRSILKPSKYNKSPNTTPIKNGKVDQAEVCAKQLTLRLHKLDKDSTALTAENIQAVLKKPSAVQQAQSSETENSTPSTVEERNKTDRAADYTAEDLKSEVRMEDLFNSDDGSDEEEDQGANNQSFAMLSSMASMRSRQNSEKVTSSVGSLGSKADLVNSMHKRERNVAKHTSEMKSKPPGAVGFVDENARRGTQRLHKRSNTDYKGLLSAVQASTNGKAALLDVNSADQDLDASLLGINRDNCNVSNLSDHLYERKKHRRNGHGKKNSSSSNVLQYMR